MSISSPIYDKMAIAAYLSNYLYDAGVLGDNAANLVFDRLVDALEPLSEEQMGDLVVDVARYREIQETSEARDAQVD